MLDKELASLSREDLQAEIRQLRAREQNASMDKARQNAVFDSALDFAMVVTDCNGNITGWNRGAEHVMGWSAEEMRGQNASRFFTPEDNAAGRIDIEMEIAARNGRASDERWHLKKDTSRFWASGEMLPLKDEIGEHIGFVKILRDRTVEHLASEALKNAEHQLQRAQEAGNVGLFSVDMESDKLQPTPEFCRLYGLPVKKNFPATDVEALIIPEDAHLVSSAAIRQRGDFVRDVEYRIRRADTGELRWIQRTGEVDYDKKGNPIRFSGIARDVTAQHQTNDALAVSEERLRTIINTIDTAFAIIEVKFDASDNAVNYRFLEANPAFEQQAGVNLHGKWVTEFAPDLERFWFETYGRVAKTGEPITFENYAEAFARWFEVRAVRVGKPDDRQIAVFFNDVTIRHVSEQRLRESEATARQNIERVQLALAAGAIIGTWFWDMPTDRFTVDDAFAKAFGLDPTLGREGIPLAQIVATVHPDDQAALAAAINEAVARGGNYAHQYRVRRADGKYYWLEANGYVNLSPDGTPLTFPGVLIDVEERRAIEAERDRAYAELRALNDNLEQMVSERTADLMRTEEQLRQSQKMEAVGQLTGGLAHDFNNLLAGITGSLELMSTRIDQGRLKDIDKYMVAAQGAAKRAAALTHRLLAFSRRQTLEAKATNVNALIHGMLELIQRTVGPSIPIDVVGSPDLGMALVDPSQLENALLNLCINARDAMPDGGKITIETANRVIDQQAALRQDMPEGPYLSLCVSDTGTGMPPDVIAKAFDPFFTTKPLGQGTGLGLSMIYGFAKQSGGQVRIHSIVSEGTTVCVYLPQHQGEGSIAEVDQSQTVVPAAESGQTVLVIDDEPTVRMLVADVLEEFGYTAIEAADSVAGLKILQSDVRVDLLITDVGLPGGMNGRQLADAGRERRINLKVLFITGYAENALIGNSQLAPGMSVLTKPFAVDALAARIHELIAQN